jgi:hypothetical protein
MGMLPPLIYADSAIILWVILTTAVTAAYDFQDSNEKHFNVLALYNSTYQNVSFVPMPFGLLRISRSLNAVGVIYFADINLNLSDISCLSTHWKGWLSCVTL